MKPPHAGRPPIDADAPTSVSLHVRLSTAQYDAAHSRARADRITLPELIRQAVANRLRDPKREC